MVSGFRNLHGAGVRNQRPISFIPDALQDGDEGIHPHGFFVQLHLYFL